MRVLQSFPVPTPTTNPYVTQLAECLETTPEVELMHFSWRCALTSSYEVFHAHWPEAVIRDARLSRAVARHALFMGLLVRLRVGATRTPVVRTLHNLRPHEDASYFTQRLLRVLDRLTVTTISLNNHTPGLPGVPNTVIPHGHYVTWFSPYRTSPSTPGHIVSFGIDQTVQGAAPAHPGIPYARRPRLAPDHSRRRS